MNPIKIQHDPIAILIPVGIKTANAYDVSKMRPLDDESNVMCLHSDLEDFKNTKTIALETGFFYAIAIIKQSGHKLPLICWLSLR